MRRVIAIGLSSALILGVFWIITLEQNRQSTLESLEQAVANDLELLSSEISVQLASLSDLTGAIGDFGTGIHEFAGSDWVAPVDDLMANAIAERPSLRTLVLTNARGIIVADTRPGAPAFGVDVSDRTYFVVHRDDAVEGAFVSSPVVSRVDGQWTWVLSRAIRAADGSLLGVIVASFDRRYFAEQFSGELTDEGFELYLVHETGTILEAPVGRQGTIASQFPQPLDLDVRPERTAFRRVELWIPGDGVHLTMSRVGSWPVYLVGGFSDAHLEMASAYRNSRQWDLGLLALGLILVGTAVFAVMSRRAERAQSASEFENRRALGLLRAAMDNCPIGIAIADAPDGRLRYVNEAGLRIRGGQADELVDGVGSDRYPSVWEIRDMDGRLLEPEEIPLFRAVRFGERTRREFIILRDDGDERVVDANAAPVFDQALNVISAVVVFEDITDRRQAKRQLELRVSEMVAKNREKDHLLIQQSKLAAMGEMIGHIAHQWRQPINALSILLSNVEDAETHGELNHEYLSGQIARAQQLIHRMSSTIDDFRDFFSKSRDKEAFYAHAAVRDAMSVVEASLLYHHIDVDVSVVDEVALDGFRREFSQVILNILSNAKESMDSRGQVSGKIEVVICKSDDQACISITDNGGGIPPDILPEIFNPYFTTRDDGSGIGLHISRLIVEQRLGGSISAENVDGGAKFRILVPLSKSDIALDARNGEER